MAAQPLSSLGGNCQIERNPCPTQSSGHTRLDQYCIRIGDGAGHEIQIGRRRILEYFLSPLLRRSYEALRER